MMMGSPADERPSPPCDAQPETEDVAEGIDKINNDTTFQINRILSQWSGRAFSTPSFLHRAGLRVFFKDREPVVGCDALSPTFVWLAGQGGERVSRIFLLCTIRNILN